MAHIVRYFIVKANERQFLETKFLLELEPSLPKTFSQTNFKILNKNSYELLKPRLVVLYTYIHTKSDNFSLKKKKLNY